MADKLYGGAWQEIDLAAARFNINMARKLSGVPVAAVVKADAYGHGICRMAELFHKDGAACIAVASQREALHLRRRFYDMPLWVMGAVLEDLIDDCISNNIIMSVGSVDEAETISAHCAKPGDVAYIQIKIDTGFHRLGIPVADPIKSVHDIMKISGLPRVRVMGIFSHLKLANKTDDLLQNELFCNIYDELVRRGQRFPRSIADSIALFRYPEMRYDMARVGALLYGCKSRETPFEPKRVMRLCAKIVSIREIDEGEGCGYDEDWKAGRRTRVATLPVGYADGVARRLRDRGEVALNGRRARYIGLPCMDQCMIDVTDIQAQVGDTVTILGGNDTDVVTFEEYSAWLNTNRNECLAAVGRRVPRVYIDGGEVVGVDDPLI
jgi:alanine racemase